MKSECETFSVCVCVSAVAPFACVKSPQTGARDREHLSACAHKYVCVYLGIRVVCVIKCVAGLISRNYTQIAFPKTVAAE